MVADGDRGRGSVTINTKQFSLFEKEKNHISNHLAAIVRSSYRTAGNDALRVVRPRTRNGC